MPLKAGIFTFEFSLANISVTLLSVAIIAMVMTLFINRKHAVETDINIEDADKTSLSARRSVTNIHQIVNDLEQFWQTQIGDKDIKFTSYSDSEIANYLSLDSLTTYNILAQLVSRAHTQCQSGQIHIHVTQKNDPQHTYSADNKILEIVVIDTGNGKIDDLSTGLNDHFSIFSLDQISQYVTSLRGQFTYNVNSGKGAEFIVRLPFKTLHINADDAQVSPAQSSCPSPREPVFQTLNDMGQADMSGLMDINARRQAPLLLEDLILPETTPPIHPSQAQPIRARKKA